MNVECFASYSHHDCDLFNQLIAALTAHVGCCTAHQINIWHDRRIQCGTAWDAVIKARLAAADVGLLFVSAHYQISNYIKTVEEPALLSKKCLAVGMRPICFKTMLGPQLAAMQFYRLITPKGKELFYSECATRQQREAFVMGLYQEILGRI